MILRRNNEQEVCDRKYLSKSGDRFKLARRTAKLNSCDYIFVITTIRLNLMH